MALTPEQQARELIQRATHILVLTREHASVDALASLCAMGFFLKQLGKSHELVAPSATAVTLPSFLTAPSEIRHEPGLLRALHIRVDARRIPVGELSYDHIEGMLDIKITPKHGEWTAQDVQILPGNERFDLAIVIDAADRASLGSLSREYAELLQRIPVINLDCTSENESWGTVNLIDLQAGATTELIHRLASQWEPNPIPLDTPFATALLAGIISKSRGFRTAHVSPRTLAVAAKLVQQGAKREEIVHGLWRTRTIPELKLWGCALSRMNMERDVGLVWTFLTEEDERATAAHPTMLDGIMEELVAYAPEARVLLLCVERGNEVHAVVHAIAPYSAMDCARPFSGVGTRERATFQLPQTDIIEGATEVAKQIRTQLLNLKK